MKNRILSVATTTISLLACLLAVPLHAQTHEHEVIYTTLPGWPQNDVPGMPGFTFYDLSDYAPQVAVSPTGQHVLMAQAYDGYTAPWILVAGGQTVLVQNDPAPWAPGETIASPGYPGVAVNSSGAIAAICETNVREYVVYSTTPGTWSVYAQEGGPTHPYPSATYTGFDSVAIGDPGAIGFRATLTGGPTHSLLEQGGSVLARVNLDAPTGQLGGGSYTYQSFYEKSNALRLTPDGTRWMGSAHLNDPGNVQVTVVDNAVVVQEHYAIPGSGIGNIAWDLKTLGFDSAGRWYATGRFYPNGNDMWAMRDGALLAASGLETYPGSGEYWSGNAYNIDFATGNGVGDWFVGGNIAVPPYGQEARVVKDGAETLLAYGDPVDMDGNGVFDDNVFFYFTGGFAQATDDGSLFMMCQLHDATTSAYGLTLLRIAPCPLVYATETTRLGTPPNPNAFVQGVTTGPIVGETWDPVIDHATFATGAVADFVGISLQGPTNIPTGMGTLLILPPYEMPIRVVSPPGTPFAIPVPADCSYVGVNAWTQGGSFTPGTGIEFANAIDIVVGTY